MYRPSQRPEVERPVVVGDKALARNLNVLCFFLAPHPPAIILDSSDER